MQYLYVLVSTINDIYYEQFLLSATSLKLKMPDAEITLLCDSKTKDTLIGKRNGYEKLVSKIVNVDTPDGFSHIEVSRWLKTSMRRFVQGDFLFIDCDTIITEDLSQINGLGITFGACLDKHSLLDRHAKSKAIIGQEQQLGFTSHLSNRHLNSGIIYCADIPETHNIFDRWHELWLFSNSKNIVRDQPSFNMAIHENSALFTELDGKWNCQIAFNGLPFLSSSKIIHYFASDLALHTSPFSLASNTIFQTIKTTGTIPSETVELLKYPKTAFVPESRIIADNDVLYVFNSSFFESILLLRQKAPIIFHFFNGLASFGKKITKFFLVKTNKNGGIKHYN